MKSIDNVTKSIQKPPNEQQKIKCAASHLICDGFQWRELSILNNTVNKITFKKFSKEVLKYFDLIASKVPTMAVEKHIKLLLGAREKDQGWTRTVWSGHVHAPRRIMFKRFNRIYRDVRYDSPRCAVDLNSPAERGGPRGVHAWMMNASQRHFQLPIVKWCIICGY